MPPPEVQPTIADRMKLLMGIEQEPVEAGFLEELEEYLTLSKEQRLYGFLYCLGLGATLSILSSLFIFNYEAFAFFYTIGNVLSLGSTAFLVGPKQQCQNMAHPHRLAATLLYLCMMALTLYVVFEVKNAVLALLCVMLQSLALSWYCLSYIPYARRIIKKCLFPWLGELGDLDYI